MVEHDRGLVSIWASWRLARGSSLMPMFHFDGNRLCVPRFVHAPSNKKKKRQRSRGSYQISRDAWELVTTLRSRDWLYCGESVKFVRKKPEESFCDGSRSKHFLFQKKKNFYCKLNTRYNIYFYYAKPVEKEDLSKWHLSMEKSNSVTSDVTSRWMARRACPASRASPTEKSRRRCILGATMKGTGQPKTRLPPTRSFVHGYCRCCCCHARCRRYRNREWTPPSVRHKRQICPRDHPTIATMGRRVLKVHVCLLKRRIHGVLLIRGSLSLVSHVICYIVRICSSLFQDRF